MGVSACVAVCGGKIVCREKRLVKQKENWRKNEGNRLCVATVEKKKKPEAFFYWPTTCTQTRPLETNWRIRHSTAAGRSIPYSFKRNNIYLSFSLSTINVRQHCHDDDNAHTRGLGRAENRCESWTNTRNTIPWTKTHANRWNTLLLTWAKPSEEFNWWLSSRGPTWSSMTALLFFFWRWVLLFLADGSKNCFLTITVTPGRNFVFFFLNRLDWRNTNPQLLVELKTQVLIF